MTMRRELLCLFFVLAAFTYVGHVFNIMGGGWMVPSTLLLALACYDALQRKHSILKNFPVLGRARYLLELVRPEIQQYFIESDTSGTPISRVYRSIVYQTAKGELDSVPFGTELDVYARDYQWLNHSCFPVHATKAPMRVMIGGPDCKQPYSASLLNISAMSYGSLSSNAIVALGKGACKGGFYHNTGEGGLSPHHLGTGADIVWQLGTAYFGARDNEGFFDPAAFAEKAQHPHVKMIEIKISQGAKPGHGGVLPGVKVDKEISEIRRVPIGKTVISPPGHTAFTTPTELCHFIVKLRHLSEGKPIGFKLCLGRREEFVAMCEAMKATGVTPDFITVDGGEGGTGAAPFDFINYVGSPLKEALYFVHSELTNYGLRERIKVIASGKVMSGFNMFEKLALGADICNSARGMMLALGCIQAYRCNTNKCPTGITTSDKRLASGLDVTDKGERVASFHDRTIEAFKDLLGAAGLHDPDEIEPKHISCRFQNRIVTLQELFALTPELSSHEQHERMRPIHGENNDPQPAAKGT